MWGALRERQGSENLVAGCAGRRRSEEFNGADLLREGQFSIDWVSAGDFHEGEQS